MLIATPNLCLDITVRLPKLVPGAVVRATATDTSAGGKGVNVARAAASLGAPVLLAGFLAAGDGDRLTFLLAGEGLALRAVDVPGVTRVASILLEDDGRVTVINGRGPEIDDGQWTAFQNLVADTVIGADLLVCSGSLSPGLPVEAYRVLTEIAHQAGVPVIVDAAPEVLRHALKARPDLVCPNLSEAEGLLFGRSDEIVDERGDDIPARAVRAARALHQAGAVRAVVTAGGSGAGLATADGTWWLAAPSISVVNPVGAGDSFAAGAGFALVSGASDLDVVRRGMAAASASCEMPTAGRLLSARAQELFRLVVAVPAELTEKIDGATTSGEFDSGAGE